MRAPQPFVGKTLEAIIINRASLTVGANPVPHWREEYWTGKLASPLTDERTHRAVIDALIQEHPHVAREIRRWTAETRGVGGRVILIEPDIVETALQLLSQFDPAE